LSGGIVSGGLGDLLKKFKQNGHGDKIESWVQPGQNADINDGQLAEALGPDVLNEIASNTGLSHQRILDRLSRDLPKAVDDLTPQGKLPTAEE
ncbi:YidB family protein, partial [Rhizobium ruizarguesonis]